VSGLRRPGAQVPMRGRTRRTTQPQVRSLALVVGFVALVVGVTFEPASGLAMTLGSVGVAEHLGRVGRLALRASGALVPRGGPVVRPAPRGVLVLLVVFHR
jgi:hypothetical protein